MAWRSWPEPGQWPVRPSAFWRSDPLLRRSVCAAGQPACPQVSGGIGLSGSGREFPALTGRSGTQRARPLRSRTAVGTSASWSLSSPGDLRGGPSRDRSRTPSPGSDGACSADPARKLALADPVHAYGAWDRPEADVVVFQCVARLEAVTAERRVIPEVPQEVHDWGRLDVPHPACRDATNVNDAVLNQNRILHTPPQRVVGTVVPFGTRTGRLAVLRVDPLAPVWFRLVQGAWAPGTLALLTGAESARPMYYEPVSCAGEQGHSPPSKPYAMARRVHLITTQPTRTEMRMTEPGSTELSVQGESLQRLYSQYTQGRFLVNRRYQRKLVWAVEEKAKLIDSVIKRLPIPLILLAESIYEGTSKLEVIDGLQRLNAIFSFMTNEFAVDDEYFDLETLADTKFLKDRGMLTQKGPILDRAVCRDIANYLLPVSTYRSATESSVDEVFRRINSSGRYLSLQEIRQAGATVEIAHLVRRISAAIRGDASLTDFVKLQDMPKISITNRDLKYGIYDANIFWVKQGILSRDAVRESRDEELVLDILLDIILRPLASSGSEYRNSAYGDDRGPAATSAVIVASRLATIGPAEVERRFMNILDLLIETLEVADAPYATLTVTQQNQRGVPRHFHALFVAVEQLVHEESLVPKSKEGFATALKGFWDKDLSIPGGGNWGGVRKSGLINSVKGHLRPSFKPTSDKHELQLQEHAIRFESTLKMALTEEALFELKQGFCRVDKANRFDDASFDKILCTASAMANARSSAKGVIFIGVADDSADAKAVERHSRVKAHELDGFYITGTQHELDALGRSIDEHFRWLIDCIKTSHWTAALLRVWLEHLAHLGTTNTCFGSLSPHPWLARWLSVASSTNARDRKPWRFLIPKL